MAVERKLDVVRMDTAAIVANADQADAASCQLDINRCRACIDTVFNDFFQGVGRAFDHFAGGDLVDEMVGQGGNSGHRFLSKKATAEGEITGICASIRIRRGRFCSAAIRQYRAIHNG